MSVTVFLYVLAGVVLISQFSLSRTKQSFWGVIIPVLYFIIFLFGWINNYYEMDLRTFLIVGVGGIVILLGIWSSNRKAVNKKNETCNQ